MSTVRRRIMALARRHPEAVRRTGGTRGWYLVDTVALRRYVDAPAATADDVDACMGEIREHARQIKAIRARVRALESRQQTPPSTVGGPIDVGARA